LRVYRRRRHFRVGDSGNPFGAGAAACFAAANVFRHVFAEQLTGGGPDRQLAVSMLNYGQQSADF